MKALLDPYERNLLDIRRRLYVMLAFQRELERVSRGKGIRIHNACAWDAMIDVRDVLVIHLASWTKGVYEQGGLLGQVQAHHLKALPQKRPWGENHEERDPVLARHRDSLNDESHRRPLRAPLPVCSGGQAEARRHRGAPRQLLGSNRAGARRSQQQPGTRLRARGQGEGRHVDMVLCGTSLQQRMAMGKRRRDDFYARLHEVHDAAGKPDVNFNENLYPDGGPDFEDA